MDTEPRADDESAEWLLDVADAIADHRPVDWQFAELCAESTHDRELLGRLKDLATIAVDEETPLSDEPKPGEHWGPLTIHEVLGHGADGDVYRAYDRRLDRLVALKLLPHRGTGIEAFESTVIDEARLMTGVHHPNVVAVHGAERIDGRVGLWMELIEGRTLQEGVGASGPLPADLVRQIGLDLCGALEAMHQAGLPHRDLNAQDVMLANDGRVVLTEFGTGSSEVPMDGEASVGSETYSLGVLLYYMATGSSPIQALTLSELRTARATGTPPRPAITARPDLPPALAAVLDRAVAVDPAYRYPTTMAMHRGLTRVRQRVPQ